MAEVTKIPEKDKVQRFLSWFRDSYRFRQAWRAEALENYSFVEGGDGQWDSADLDKLRKEERPHLTINRILPQILTLDGLQRANRLDIRALPRGSSDTQAADLMSSLIEYVGNRSNADHEQSQIFTDGNICGIGVLEVVRSYDDDLEGELVIRSVDPLQVFFDPDGRRADLDDSRFVMKAPFKDVEELVHSFSPDLESQIRDMAKRMKNDDWLTAFGVDRSLTGNLREELGEVFYDRDTRKVRVLEVYYRTTRRLAVVEAPDGEVIPIESGVRRDESPFDAAKRHAKAIGGEASTRKIKIVRIATVLGWEILQDVESPFPTRRFPLVPYMPLMFRRQPYGAVRHLKDPQREINKRRSQALHHMNQSANSGWLNPVDGGADPKVLEQANKPGIVINYQQTGSKPEKIIPSPLPAGLVQLESMASQDIDRILVQEALQGEGTQKFISGKAIQSRQFGGQVKVTRFYDQLSLTRKLLGELLVSIIPRIFSERRIREIVDQELARSPEGRVASLIQEAQGTNTQALEQGVDPVDDLIARARKLRFDIVVSDVPASPTQRQAAFNQLLQIATLMPGSVSADELLEASDLKNKDELVAKLLQRQQQGLVQQSERGAGAAASERLDLGDLGAQAQTLTGGQDGPGEQTPA